MEGKVRGHTGRCKLPYLSVMVQFGKRSISRHRLSDVGNATILDGFTGCKKSGHCKLRAPPAAKACVDFAALTARLKPRPFKTKSKPEFFADCEAVPATNPQIATSEACFRVPVLVVPPLLQTISLPPCGVLICTPSNPRRSPLNPVRCKSSEHAKFCPRRG